MALLIEAQVLSASRLSASAVPALRTGMSLRNATCVTAPGTGLLLWSGDCQIDGRPSRMPWAGPT